MSSLRNFSPDLKLIFENTQKICNEMGIKIPGKKIDENSEPQHPFKIKYDEKGICYFIQIRIYLLVN